MTIHLKLTVPNKCEFRSWKGSNIWTLLYGRHWNSQLMRILGPIQSLKTCKKKWLLFYGEVTCQPILPSSSIKITNYNFYGKKHNFLQMTLRILWGFTCDWIMTRVHYLEVRTCGTESFEAQLQLKLEQKVEYCFWNQLGWHLKD